MINRKHCSAMRRQHECVCAHLRGRGHWRGRTVSRPQLLRSWCRLAGLAVLASHWADISLPLRSTESYHFCCVICPPCLAHSQMYTQVCVWAGAYRCNLSCSSGVSVRVDTHTRSCPGCLCSRTHSCRCWCCTHRYLRQRQDYSTCVGISLFSFHV